APTEQPAGCGARLSAPLLLPGQPGVLSLYSISPPSGSAGKLGGLDPRTLLPGCSDPRPLCLLPDLQPTVLHHSSLWCRRPAEGRGLAVAGAQASGRLAGSIAWRW